MKKLIEVLLCIAIVFLCGFMSCESQIQDILPSADQSVPDGMVLIPAGEVTLGLSQAQFERHLEQYPPTIPVTMDTFITSNNEFRPAEALPVQTVFVDAFYMDTHEVTYQQYKAFVDASGYVVPRFERLLESFPEFIDRSGYFGNKPIVQLTIPEMKAYAEFYGKQIPTEVEWEKAARGGRIDASYPHGNTIDASKANYNHEGHLNALVGDRWVVSSKEPGQYPPNGYGLYDMAGNVSEYVTTDWDDDNDGADVNAVIARGGNYRRPGHEVQNWYRAYQTIGPAFGSVGFRCVKRF